MKLGLTAVVVLLFCASASAAQIQLPNFGGLDPSFDGQLSTGMDSSAGQTWPSLVGMDATEAKARIEAEAPGKSVYLVPTGSIVTMDWRQDRVRIFYDQASNKVAEVPRVG